MARRRYAKPIKEEYNPFKVEVDLAKLRNKLDRIDNHTICARFKATEDPIVLAFETVDKIPLEILARDIVKDGFNNIISFVSKLI